MDNIISLIHRTNKKNYNKIIKDEYLLPHKSITGNGVYLTIKINENQVEKQPLINYGDYEITIDKSILFNRSDYIIRNMYYNKKTYFVSKKIIFDAHKDSKTKLEKKLKSLVLLNEIVFDNEISLNKYIF